MRRLFGWAAVLAVAPLILVEPTRAPAADAKPAQFGYGPAYEAIGRLPIMHTGRVKPLDTVAREEIKVIHSRETIKLRDEDGKVVATWSPVAAFLDWSARPDFWDDQRFILVEYLPLKQAILSENIKVALKGIAEKPTTASADAAALKELAAKDKVSHQDLKGFLASSKLAEADGKAVFRFATLLGEETKWLSPNDLEKAVITEDGHKHSFNEWVSELAQKGRGTAMSSDKPALSELERKAFDVGTNYFRYRVHRDGQVLSTLQILGMPRPFSQDNDSYLKFYAGVIEKYRSDKSGTSLTPAEMDAIQVLDGFFETLPRKDHDEIGGTNTEFNNRFKLWLKDKAAWMPLPVVLKEKADVLLAAGYPTDKVEGFRKAYEAWQAEEEKAPGNVSLAASDAVIKAAYALGTSVNPGNYPSESKMALETHFNEFAPFYLCQFSYGAGILLLLASLMVSALGAAMGRESSVAVVSKAAYFAGLAGLIGGIGLEAYGFYLRIVISGWAPVTNMYETVIWVALVGATLGLILEAIYGGRYIALAATGLGFVTTLIAYNSSSIMDPNIKALQPVLRSNLWLTIHVITIVSSYAAFALATMIGLIASTFYLTATYRRSLSLWTLFWPSLVAAPLGYAGYYGVLGSLGTVDLGQAVRDYGYIPSLVLCGLGIFVTATSLFSVIGEVLSWALFREDSAETVRQLGDLAQVEAVASAEAEGWESAAYKAETTKTASAGGAVATAPPPTKNSVIAAVRARQGEDVPRLSARERSMQATASQVKPLSSFVYRAMQVGVLLVAAGTILGGFWADVSWGRFWGWDPKEVWALITLLVYLIPLHGRFAGWINTSTLIFSSVVCFMAVLMAWYGVNFILGVGLHSYGFSDGQGQGLVGFVAVTGMGFAAAGKWRRHLGLQAPAAIA